MEPLVGVKKRVFALVGAVFTLFLVSKYFLLCLGGLNVAPTVLAPDLPQIHLPQVPPVLASVGAAQPCVAKTLLSLFMGVASSQN